ncbi:MAG: glycosyltransferase family A protein [Pyrinomonadaceae bacterium]
MKKLEAKKSNVTRDPNDIPKVSVVIPAYNSAGNIVETLESVFGQEFRSFEIVLVNDGSPDTEEFERVIGPYLEKIVYIKQPNAGAAEARNTGIERSRGEIIAFLDSDDIWYPEYLASQVAFLESNGLGMAYCDAELFGMPSVIGTSFMDGSPSSGEVSVESLLDIRCNVITSGTIARKRVIEAAGMFERNKRVQSEDFHLWVRIAHLGERIGYQRCKLLKYRVSVEGLSGDSVNRVWRAIDVFQRLDRDVNLTEEQRSVLLRRIEGFEADMEIEKGKAYLVNGYFVEASRSFASANRRRRSIKLAGISILTRIFPRLVLKMFEAKNAGEIAFIQKLDGSSTSR